MRIELLVFAGIEIISYHVRQCTGLSVRERSDRVVFPDLPDETHDLGPRQSLDIDLIISSFLRCKYRRAAERPNLTSGIPNKWV